MKKILFEPPEGCYVPLAKRRGEVVGRLKRWLTWLCWLASGMVVAKLDSYHTFLADGAWDQGRLVRKIQAYLILLGILLVIKTIFHFWHKYLTRQTTYRTTSETPRDHTSESPAAAPQRSAKQIRHQERAMVKAALKALQQTVANHPEKFSDLQGAIKAEIKRNPHKVSEAVQQQNLTPQTLIYVIALNILADTLSSGHLHVYRGVLSLEGMHQVSVFDYCLKQLTKNGVITPKDASESKAGLSEAIKGVG